RLLAPRGLVAVAGLDLLAEHRPALLLDGQPLRTDDAIDYGGEDEGARAPGLDGDVGQLGLTAQALADTDGPVEAEALPPDPPPRQGRGRHHARVARAAVGTQLVGAEAREEVEDMPARRQRVARRE